MSSIEQPYLDIVIPARNEASLLPSTLESILGNAQNLRLNIVVVLNGEDRFAMREQAECFVSRFDEEEHNFHIIECEHPSKVAALNAGDAARSGRNVVVYLDADSVLLPGTLTGMAEVLSSKKPILVGPKLCVVRPTRLIEKGFADLWQHLPAVANDVIGAGCYGVNPCGRHRWGAFPKLSADDAYVRSLFKREERVVAERGGLLFVFPEARSLLRTLRRWRNANSVLRYFSARGTGAGLVANMCWLFRCPGQWRNVPGFIGIYAGSLFAHKESNGTGEWKPDRCPAYSQRDIAKQARVQAVIVTYNSSADIIDCLNSISSDWASIMPVVVDNASDDDTLKRVSEVHPLPKIVRNNRNWGFGKAVNLATAEMGDTDYILLLNPDAVLRPDSIDALLALALRFPNAGIYGGRMLHPDGGLDQTSCLAMPTLAHAAAFGFGLSLLSSKLFDPDSLGGWKRTGTREVPALTGGLLLIDAKLWVKLGGFDERYFLYGEDIDLCMRARRIGARPLFTDSCIYTHRGGASSATQADRNVAILTGKATLYAQHVFLPFRKIALQFLVMGTGLRFLLERLLRRRQRVWRESWSRRREWRNGWPLSTPHPPSSTQR